MKILVVSHAYVERDNHQKLLAMAKNEEVELAVVYPKKWKTWHGQDRNQKLEIRDQKSYKEFPLETLFTNDGGKYFYNPIQLIVSILEFKPDLIHVEEEPFSFVSCQLSVVSWLLRTKLTFFSWENVDLPLGKKRSWIEGFVFKKAAGAIAGNQGAKARLLKRGFSQALEVVSQFGVDPYLFHPPKETPSLSKALVVGFVGRPVEAKGVDLLLKAVAKLEAPINLLVVTSSARIPAALIKLAIDLGIRERVDFEANVAHAGLPDYFQKMDVFVLPSRTTATWQEQFGRALIEAMACGVPVIGSSSGAIPEVVGQAGLIFQEENLEDLASKIRLLLDPQERKKLKERGLKHVEDNYSSLKVAQKTSAFFQRSLR